jgi:hypothetical protein
LLRLHVSDIFLYSGKPHAALFSAVMADLTGHIGHFRFKVTRSGIAPDHDGRPLDIFQA